MPKINLVYPVDLINSEAESVSNNNRGTSTDSGLISLPREGEAAVSTAQRRKETFRKILSNDYPEKEPWKYIFTGLTGVLMSLGVVSVYTLVPWHDPIKNPHYFYEALIVCCFPLALVLAADWTMIFSHSTNIKNIRTFGFCFKLWIVLIFTITVAFVLLTLTWIYVMNYQLPVPFNGYIILLISYASYFSTIWFHLPKEWRQDQTFKKRFQRFMMGATYIILTQLAYNMIMAAVQATPANFQWIVALFLPLVREITLMLALKIFAGSANGDFDSTRVFWTFDIGVIHANALALTLGNSATAKSASAIIGMDFVINLFICLRMIYLKHKDETPENVENLIELTQTLILNEWVEVTAPIGFLGCLILGFYGPNKDIIGDIGASYWQFKAIEDIGRMIQLLSAFFVVDSVSLLITTYLLWKFCNVNLYKGFVALKGEFGWAFATSFTVNLTGRFVANMILLGTDLTFQFDWKEGHFNNSEPNGTMID